MNTKKINQLIKASQKATEALAAAVEEMQSEGREKWAATNTASNAYLDDVRNNRRLICKRIAEIDKQIEDISANVKEFQPDLTSATINSNKAQIQEIQTELTNLEAQRAALVNQKSLLESAITPGSEDLYHAAELAAEDLRGFYDALWASLCSVDDFVKEQIDVLEKMKRKAVGSGRERRFICRESRAWKKAQGHHSGNTPLEEDIQGPAPFPNDWANLETDRHVYGEL